MGSSFPSVRSVLQIGQIKARFATRLHVLSAASVSMSNGHSQPGRVRSLRAT